MMSGISTITNLVAASTNVLLNFLLPQVAQFAQRVDLPEKTASVADVRQCGNTGGYYLVVFKNGDIYRLYSSYVQSFESPRAYYALQDPNLVPKFYGPLKMTESEAVDLARLKIRELGYTEEMVYADLKPEVSGPIWVGTNVIPRFLITWPSPNRPPITSARFEINAMTKKIESAWFLNDNLKHPVSLPSGIEAEDFRLPPELSADKSRVIMLSTLSRVADFAKTLGLWSGSTINSSQVKGFRFFEDAGVFGKIELTNGLSFSIQEGQVMGFWAPDEFFGNGEVRVKDFLGQWKISEAQAVSLAREAAKKVGVPATAVAATPEIDKPYGGAKDLVPRCIVTWQPARPELRWVRVEVDGASGTVKSLKIH